MNNSTDLNTEKILEVRKGGKGYYLFWGIAWVMLILSFFILPSKRQDTIDIFYNWKLAKLPVFLVIIGIPVICLYNYLDTRVKIKIDDLGIWTKKHGTIFWNDIISYRTKQVYLNEGNLYILILILNETDPGREIEIEFKRMDKSIDEIREVISYYATQCGIENMGHKKGLF
jgi:hypothetical protein